MFFRIANLRVFLRQNAMYTFLPPSPSIDISKF